jgi:hypothetical protein
LASPRFSAKKEKRPFGKGRKKEEEEESSPN